MCAKPGNYSVVTLVALICLLCGLGGCAARPIAISGVTVIKGDGTAPVRDATVVIDGDTIAAVSRDAVIPSSAKVIDGRGKFLVPGFWDMHVHLSKTRPSAMKLFVANGVTSVRDMGGDIDELLDWRSEVASGERIGPTIYTAGSYLESPANIRRMLDKPVAENVEPVAKTRIAVANPDEARRIVGDLASRGVDMIKVRESVDTETYVAIGQAAHSHGLPLVAHTMEVPLEQIVEAHTASIEHFFIPFLDDVPAAERNAFFRELADTGAVFVPNLYLNAKAELVPNSEILEFLDDDGNQLDPRRAMLSKYLLKDWREQLQQDRSDDRKEFFRRLMRSVIRDAKEMRAAGVPVLPGTDTAVLFVFPGWALQEELALYVDLLGFTPAEAMEAASREAAEYMGVGDVVGTVEAGKRADLLLLDADPLADIRNTARIDTVFQMGRMLDSAAIADLLDSVRSAPDVLEDTWGRYP